MAQAIRTDPRRADAQARLTCSGSGVFLSPAPKRRFPQTAPRTPWGFFVPRLGPQDGPGRIFLTRPVS